MKRELEVKLIQTEAGEFEMRIRDDGTKYFGMWLFTESMRSAVFHQTQFNLSKSQAMVLRKLLQSHEDGLRKIHHNDLKDYVSNQREIERDASEDDSSYEFRTSKSHRPQRIRDIYNKHPFWGTVIKSKSGWFYLDFNYYPSDK